MNTDLDYYSLLGLKRAASPEEIKRAYRQMVFRYHPDRNPGDETAAGKFKQVLDAYGVLSDGAKRAVYDAVNSPAEAEEEPVERPQQEEKPGFSGEANNGFTFSQTFTGQEFRGKVEPDPKCPTCSVVGIDHIISRKGGSGGTRGKQFVLAPFNVIFCDACGHVYGVTINSG
ncbi:MAG: J domain-containing protein [Candidatus Binatia bacterium]